MAIEKTVILNVETKEAAKNIDILSQSFEDAYGEIQPLTGRMGELEDQLYELANAGKQGTDEFKILSEEVGRMKKTIQQTDMQVDALAKTTSQKLGGALNFVAGGFSTFQGALGAVGVDSAKLEETMLKVQSAMAITQGIDSMREGYKDIKGLTTDLAKSLAKSAAGQKLLSMAQAAGAATMKVLNFVMKQNPILLIVTAVAALVAAFALLGNAEEDEAAKQKRLVAARKKAEEQLEREISLIKQKQKLGKGNVNQLQNELDIMKSKGATDEQLYKKEKEINNKRLNDLAYLKGYRGKLSNDEATEYNRLLAEKQILTNEYNNNLKEKEAQASAERQSKAKENRDKQKQNLEKERDDKKSAIESIKALEQEYADSKLSAQELELVNIDRKYQDELEAAKKYKQDTTIIEAAKAQEKADINKKYEDERLKIIEAANIEAANLEKKRQEEYLLQIESLDELNYQNSLSERDRELLVVQDKYFALELAAAGNAEQLAIIEQAKNDELAVINDKHNAQDLEKRKQLNEARLNAVKDGLSSISNLAELFAGKSKESQRKAFNVQKAVNIATATIDTYRSAQAAYASGSAINPIFGAVSAAAAITAGLLNVKKIAATKFDDGGGASSGGGGGISAPQAPDVQAANFNVVGAGGANQLAQLSSNPIKAYVVSGDVTSAQSLDRNIVKNATI